MVDLHHSLRLLFLGLLVGLGLLELAPQAAAEEIGLVVERSAQTDEPIPLVLLSDATGPIEITVHHLSQPDRLIEAGAALGDGNALVWLGTGRDAVAMRRKRPKLARLHNLVTPRVVHRRTLQGPHTLKRKLVPLRWSGYEAGLYLLEARSATVTTRVTALVSDLALVLKRDPTGALVWATNRRTGRAWPAVEITSDAGQGLSGQTNKDGVLRVRQRVAPTVALRAIAGMHLALGTETYFPTRSTDHRVYVFPHQPAYRPGETVEIKGIVRAFDGERLRVDPRVRSAKVVLVDARNADVHQARVDLTPEHGTLNFSYALPKDAPTGTWRVRVAWNDGRSYEGTFLVDAYRKPTIQVGVRAVAPRVLAGAETRFEIDASFYEGGPVAGAPVTWQVLYNRVDRDLLATDEIVRLFFGTEREAYRPQTLATGKGRLDAEGRMILPIEAPAEARDGYLSVRATVTGPDRIAVVGSGGVAIDAAPVRVALNMNKTVYAPEDLAAAEILVETADGRPAAGRAGLLSIASMQHAGAGGAPTERWESNLEFTTDAKGLARVDVPLVREGQFRLSVAVARVPGEPRGPAAHASVDVWVAGDKPTLGLPASRLEVVADKTHYAPGDTARLLVRAPGAKRAVLATVEGATLMRHDVLHGGDASVWTLEVTPEHAPNVFATFVTMADGDMQVRTVQVRVPPAHKVLTAEVMPDASLIQPGETTGVTVTIRDAAGAPVPGAEVTLAVVDEALYALHRDAQAPLAAFFHAARRNNVTTQGMAHHDSVGRAVRVPPPPRRATGGAQPSARPGAVDGAPPAGAPVAPTSPAPNPTAPMPPTTGEAAPSAGSSCGSDAGSDGEEPIVRDEEAAAVEESENLDEIVREGASMRRMAQGGKKSKAARPPACAVTSARASSGALASARMHRARYDSMKSPSVTA